MAPRNRLTIIFYFVGGAIVGALAGMLLDAIFSDRLPEQVEARVMLFRLPTNDTYHAARDFLAFSISRPGFLEKFAEEQALDQQMRALISQNLRVTAENPASTIAELALTGMEEKKLVTTLDALAVYLSETLRSVNKSEMDKASEGVEREIRINNEERLALENTRRRFGPITDSVRREIQTSASFATERKELELLLRYSLKPLSKPEELSIRRKLKQNIDAEEQHEERLARSTDTSNGNFVFAKSLAINDAVLRALRRTKQRLVIEFNKATPLRIASGAKVTAIAANTIPVSTVIGVGIFVGAMLGGLLWSIRRTKNFKLTGLVIERQLRIPTAAVISKRSTDLGIKQGQPLARTEPQSEDLAGIRSLAVATCFLNTDSERNFPWIFTELGKGNQVGHVMANLALVVASRQARVLVVEASPKSTELSALFERGAEKGWVGLVTAEDLSAGRLPNDDLNRGRITYCHEQGRAVTLEDMANFDCVLIHTKNASDAKNRLADCEQGLGLVLCTAATRISILRKALGRSLGKKMHGVVLCGDSN